MDDGTTASRPAAPERAHTLVCKLGGDTGRDLAEELRRLAELVERGRLSVGCGGSASAGGVWSYRVAPGQTHAAYFRQVEAWLGMAGGAPAR